LDKEWVSGLGVRKVVMLGEKLGRERVEQSVEQSVEQLGDKRVER
jgi:hypothetical protein